MNAVIGPSLQKLCTRCLWVPRFHGGSRFEDKMVQYLYVTYTYLCLLNNLSLTYNAKHSKCYIVIILVCVGNNAKRKRALQIFI